MRAAAGVKKFLTQRLSKLNSILQRSDSTGEEQPAYLIESESKHPDSWENAGDGKWIRHHAVARRDPFIPCGSSDGPALEDLDDTRLTERVFPDGKEDRLLDQWRTSVPLVDEVSLWRGRIIFYVKGKKPNETMDRTHTPTTSDKVGGRIRKMVEICSCTIDDSSCLGLNHD